MKRPQTKFHADTMSDLKVVIGQKNQNFLAAEFFSFLLFTINTCCCAFASLFAVLKSNGFLLFLTK